MEKDDELVGIGNSYTTEFRQYDPRIGRWTSIDPAFKKYSSYSPYHSYGNNPVFITDPSGDDWWKTASGKTQWLPNNVDPSFYQKLGWVRLGKYRSYHSEYMKYIYTDHQWINKLTSYDNGLFGRDAVPWDKGFAKVTTSVTINKFILQQEFKLASEGEGVSETVSSETNTYLIFDVVSVVVGGQKIPFVDISLPHLQASASLGVEKNSEPTLIEFDRVFGGQFKNFFFEYSQGKSFELGVKFSTPKYLLGYIAKKYGLSVSKFSIGGHFQVKVNVNEAIRLYDLGDSEGFNKAMEEIIQQVENEVIKQYNEVINSNESANNGNGG